MSSLWRECDYKEMVIMSEHPFKKYGIIDPEFLEHFIEDPEIYEYCYNYFLDEMPYGVAKARDGDPSDWIYERLERDFHNHEQ